MASEANDLAVLTRLVPVAGRDVVDVGCGDGGLAAGLARAGARVTGLEVSPDKLDTARRARDGSGVRFALGRGEALGLPDDSADVVVYLRSLHHVPVDAMGGALDEARRVLRPGGLLYVAEPLAEGAFFAMVELVEDETEVRAAAQAALSAADEHGFAHVAAERYELEMVCRDLETVRARIVGVDPARAPAFERVRDELARRFATGGEPDPDGGRRFATMQRADVLRAGA
jgi:SAM-dependent methyltransferase